MSDLMLLGVLGMPLPDNPAELDLITWAQVKDRMLQAHERITADAARIKELEAALARTDSNRETAMLDAAEEHARADASAAMLREAVEAGEFPHGINGAAREVFPYHEDARLDHGLTAAAAFDGSVDAALALMGAVLPGWGWSVNSGGEAYVCDDGIPPIEADGDTPARALLLAVLKAMEAAHTEEPRHE